ncbi:MAG: M15 family metallopeptidase [Clostridia bacterium]|nr:M15 family metallopeptidase [Clostridia bacterium]
MKKTMISAVLLFCLLLQGCIRMGPQPNATGEGGDLPTVAPVKHYYLDMQYSYQTQVDPNLLTTGLHADYLLLANKEYPLGRDFVPASLTALTCTTYGGKTVELDARAAQALYLMLQEMAVAGVTDIAVTSGYRSYEYQVSLFNYYLSQEQKQISSNAIACFGSDYIQRNYYDKGVAMLSASDAKTVVLSYSAYPGTSEHQTGLCVDFMTSTMSELDATFATTQAFAWLSNNAYRFGFILRYPEGKEAITGYTYEPWHYRFVGREAATDIYFGNLTLEDYLGK